MLSSDLKNRTQQSINRHRLFSSIIAAVGYILSPLSWWNDLFVNVPLAYGFSWPFTLLDQRLFLPAFIVGYWLSNLLGFILLHHGIAGLVRQQKTKNGLLYNIIVTILYTAVITVLVWLQWIPSPAVLTQTIKPEF